MRRLTRTEQHQLHEATAWRLLLAVLRLGLRPGPKQGGLFR